MHYKESIPHCTPAPPAPNVVYINHPNYSSGGVGGSGSSTLDLNRDGVVDSDDNSRLAFWTDRNHKKVNCEARETTLGYGITDIGELEALGAAGAIQTIKLNPYKIQRKATA